MKILVVGSGGREHAMVWKLAKSPKVEKIIAAPGNGGIATENKATLASCKANDLEGLCRLAIDEMVDLAVIGPEAPLALGLADRLRSHKVFTVGPSQQAAALESSKAFSKDCMRRYGVPTAEYQVFTNAQEALASLRTRKRYPVVVKADELAAGKGVVVAATEDEAKQAVNGLFSGRHCGVVSRRVVVEDFLPGEEMSFICLVDEKTIVPLATSRDYKARDAGGRGPNTGGMGAYSPSALIDQDVHGKIMREIMHPVVEGLRDDGVFYTGFLYAGLMISEDGTPRVLEFNCRLGDPETQVILPRLQSDFAELCRLAAGNRLMDAQLHWDKRAALTVVMAANGYPDKNYQTGVSIAGLDQVHETVKVFHAGTRRIDGHMQTAGGRVLSVTAWGASIEEARASAYAQCEKISWAGSFYRPDIGR